MPPPPPQAHARHQYPVYESFHGVVSLHGDCPSQADELCTAEAVKHLLGRRPLGWLPLQTVGYQVLHVWPWGAAVLLYVVDWTTLGGEKLTMTSSAFGYVGKTG